MAEKPVTIPDAERKAELRAELALSRERLTLALRETGEDLNLASRLKHSIVQKKTAWLTGAAFAGWVLSRLPGRRKVVLAVPEKAGGQSHWTSKKTGRTGLFLAALDLLFNLFKPFLTALATRKIGQLSARSDWRWGGH